MKLKLEYILGGFGIGCLLFALIFSGASSNEKALVLPGSGGIFSPITVKKNNTVYGITINNDVPLNAWSNISVDVLDNQKQLLFNFSDGMWHESGYDSDGRWTESKNQFTMDITFQKAGQYYLRVSAERNDGVGQNIQISVARKSGSHIPFLILGIISLVCAAILFYLYRAADPKTGEPLIPKQSLKRSVVFTIIGVLALFFIIALFASTRGYGYMGYYGYHHGPSFFYWGGPRIYNSRSYRGGSIGGFRHRGGGFGGGK
ncbi:hypothetical protein AB835_05055 [Candidatus Endobugula sertula]|uniref:Uncharacterized protein n=1 Tax=Candidatus Endobugula sertula TaxID=62101 RepID=A0A1D2QRD9_9GAMM|nr:hypothetical protein AB835_05055 [Candidatus Endobugula sertula]